MVTGKIGLLSLSSSLMASSKKSMKRSVAYELQSLYADLEKAEERLMVSDTAADRWQAGQDYDNILATIQDLKESVYT
jgi:hypothetical protein